MKKLIEVLPVKNLIECDNCDYVVPHPTGDINYIGYEYLNKPCPKCGTNLLTLEDLNFYKTSIKIINFLNKWFSWLTIFSRNKKEKKVVLKTKDGKVYISDKN